MEYSEESKRNRMYKMLYGVPKEIKEKFQYDDEATWSFTDLRIGLGLCKRLLTLPGITKQCVVTDATASVGGNTIAFATYFKHVNSIELNPERKIMLDNNINLMKLGNVTTYQGYAQDILPTLSQDIVFFDPPWGTDYKKYQMMKITINNSAGDEQSAEEFINSVNTKYFVVKLPQNYDLAYLRGEVDQKYECVHTEWHGKPNTSVVLVFKRR